METHPKPETSNPTGSRRVVLVRGLPIDVCSHEEVLQEMDRHIRTCRRTQYISITNAEVMYHAARVAFLPDHIRKARFSLCDSISLVIIAALHGHRLRRFSGPVLMEKSLAFGATRNWRHFFYGGPPGLADLLSQRLTARFPGLLAAGTLCSKFRSLTPDEENEMVETINNAKPDILWVGLGGVRQDGWIARYSDRLNVPWLVGVGGAFDCHAGTTPWSPRWIRALGMEWLYRLCKEPWRFKRILSAYINLLEAVLETIVRRPVILGNRKVNEPPPFCGKTDIGKAPPPVKNTTLP